MLRSVVISAFFTSLAGTAIADPASYFVVQKTVPSSECERIANDLVPLVIEAAGTQNISPSCIDGHIVFSSDTAADLLLPAFVQEEHGSTSLLFDFVEVARATRMIWSSNGTQLSQRPHTLEKSVQMTVSRSVIFSTDEACRNATQSWEDTEARGLLEGLYGIRRHNSKIYKTCVAQGNRWYLFIVGIS